MYDRPLRNASVMMGTNGLRDRDVYLFWGRLVRRVAANDACVDRAEM